jgi:signal transduction histidine kinase
MIRHLIIFSLCALFSYSLLAQASKSTELDPSIRLIVLEGDECLKVGEDTCTLIYKRALKEAKKLKSPLNLDYLYFKISRAYWLSDNLEEALSYSDSAIVINESKGGSDLITAILNIKAASLGHMGMIDSSIQMYIRVAEILERDGDSLYLIYTLSNIAMAIEQTENFEEATKYLKKSYDLAIQMGEQQYRPTIAANLSLGYYNIGQFEEAERLAMEVIQMEDISLDQVAQSIAYYSLALLYNTKNPEQAIEYARKSVELVREKKLRSSTAGDALEVYAKLLYDQKKYKDALILIRESIDIFEKVGKYSSLSQAYKLAARISYELKDFMTSAGYWNKYGILQDSLLPTQSKNLINELSVKYETEKKEREIFQNQLTIQKQRSRMNSLLSFGAAFIAIAFIFFYYYRSQQALKLKDLQKQKEIDALKAWMMGEEHERNRISKDLHDGVASLLAAAKINLEVLKAKNQDEVIVDRLDKVSDILEKSHQETRRIAHNLLPLTLDQHGLLAAIDEFVKMIQSFGVIEVEYLQSINDSILLPKATQLMLFRILQEIVQNTIKHSDASLLKIQLDQEAKSLRLKVSDNGKGIDWDQVDSNKQGLFTIEQRIQSLGGRFKINSAVNQGVQIELILQDAIA